MAEYIRFTKSVTDYEHDGDMRYEIRQIENKYGGKYVSHDLTRMSDIDPDYEDDEEYECEVTYDIPSENAVRFRDENDAYPYSVEDSKRLDGLRKSAARSASKGIQTAIKKSNTKVSSKSNSVG